MSDRKSIDWELMKLRPGIYNLFEHLDRWFKDHNTLRLLYDGVPRMQLPNWDRMRRRQKRLDLKENSKWRGQAQRRLLALGLAARGLADRLWEVGYDSWLLRNCRPAGGEWKGSHYDKGPTGKSCRCRACPWCWLRMYAFLKQLIAGKGVVAHPMQSHVVTGLGLGQTVACKIYESLDRGVLHDLSFKEFKSVVDKDFRKCSDVDESSACKLCVPVFSVEEGWGARISYIYRHGRTVSISQLSGIRSVVFDKLLVDKALSKCYPYASEFLNDRLNPLIVQDVLSRLADTRSYTVVG